MSGVYFAEHPHDKDACKIGKSNYILKRIQNLNTAHYKDITFKYVVYTDTDPKYSSGTLLAIEKHAHEYFKQYRIRDNREWFKMALTKDMVHAFVLHMTSLGYDVDYSDDIRDATGFDSLEASDYLLTTEERDKNAEHIRDIISDMGRNKYHNLLISNDSDSCPDSNSSDEENSDSDTDGDGDESNSDSDSYVNENKNEDGDGEESESDIDSDTDKDEDRDEENNDSDIDGEESNSDSDTDDEDIKVEIEQYIAKPAQYQSAILDKMVSYYDENKRGSLILPPGYGKSYMAGFFIKRQKYTKVLVLTSQIAICNDFSRALDACCVDNCILNSAEKTTKKYNNNYTATVTTYQSYLKYAKKINKIKYDLVVYDEAHHVCADEYRKSLRLRGKKLFLTATKKVSKFKSDDPDDDVEFDMSHKDFGDIIHEESIEYCIHNGMLCDYKLYACDWTKGLVYIIKQLIHDYHRKHIILFFNSVKNSQKVCADLCEAELTSFHMDASTKHSARRNILERFSAETSILCNVNLVSEGVNIPCIDCIFFMEQRNSNIGVIQNLGRGLRVHTGKDMCMVIMTQTMLQEKSMIRALRSYDSRICHPSMRISYSRELLYELNGICNLIEISAKETWQYKYEICLEYEKKYKKKIVMGAKFKNIDISGWVNSQKRSFKADKLSKEQIEKMERLMAWITLEGIWQYKYELCVEYEKKKNKKITENVRYKNENIGQWTSGQKSAFNKNKLSEEQIEKMKKLMAWATYESEWQRKYELCVAYEKKKNDKIVSNTKYKNEKIGSWITNQKSVFKDPTKRHRLSKERLNKLKKLKFWISQVDQDETWQYKYELCVAYEKKKNDKIVSNTKYKNEKIGSWIATQKSLFKGTIKDGKLSEERLKKLRKLQVWKEWETLNNNDSDSDDE